MKKLSIITINFNNRDGLRRTIESVVAQTTRDFEYIVIDGGSTDGSIDVIKEYEEYIDYWVSEPDKGIYNAMNKGVQQAHGEYCQFLNSGDWLFSNIVIEIVLPFLDRHQFNIITGYTNTIADNGLISRNSNSNPKYLCLHHLLNTSLAHPSSFIDKNLLIENPYDENMKIVSDWKFFVESYLKDIKFACLNFDVAFFDTTGISSQQATFARNEGAMLRDKIAHPCLLNEIQVITPEILEIFNSIKQSYRLRRLIILVCKCIVKLYAFIKPSGITNANNKHQVLSPIILPKNQIKNYHILRN